MPIVNRPSNNRLMPTNTRAVDVARQSIDRITGTQSRRYDNAFQVQASPSVLYSKLKGGVTCACQAKTSKVPKSLLDEDGNAGPGVINHLLTGQQFGTMPYGAVPSKPVFGPLMGGGSGIPIAPINNLYDSDEPTVSKPFGGSPGTGFIEEEDFEISNSDVVITDGFADVGPVSGSGTVAQELFDQVLGNGMDLGFDVSSDVACPICFGTGFVGGFSVNNGVRIVLDSQLLDSSVGSNALIDLEPFIPFMQGKKLTFKPVVLPKGALGIDSVRLYNLSKVVPALIQIDGFTLPSEAQLTPYCDGRPHTFSFVLTGDPDTVGATHAEIQYNQSSVKTLFEFPKLTQGSVETMLEKTDPFQIIMSPTIPNVSTGDVLTDSTYGKVFQITSSNWWNDKRRAVLGWECQVRPCQPQELYSILPRRRPMASQNTPSMVRLNTDKRY